MRVYVAAASAEADRAERVMNEIRAAGHTIAFDWIPSVREAIAAGIDEADIEDERARQIALTDAHGVTTSDVTVFLAPTFTSCMSWMEAGIAIGRGIPLVVSRDDPRKRRQSIGLSLAHARVADAEICGAIVGAFYMGRRV